ncbi:carbon-nitrogen hydrolase family protein [Nocardioides sp. LHG3406-4]|uniref:carbon-nitrogen hydrolase family protein n=1 Tax=Nocardioides sp. LHG3406-4 TaxID=2804575 RepID=UPI003CF2EA56
MTVPGDDHQPTRMRVRLLQTDPGLGDVAGNLRHLSELVAAEPDVDLVVTPELATHGYHLSELEAVEAIASDAPALLALGDHGPTVIAGFAEQSGPDVHNSAVITGGGQVVVQRKISLPHYRQWVERRHFRPGDATAVHTVAGAQVAVLICNDMWQPPLPWLAAQAGAEVLVVPVNSVESNVGSPTADVWDVILRHAALTLQAFVVFVNRSGVEAGSQFWGGSRVVAPDGRVIAQLGAEVGALTVELDLEWLRRLRAEWPLLADPPMHVVAETAARLASERGR